MTTERWDDARLDRLAALTENNTRQISDLRSSVASLVGVVEQHQENFEIVIAEIREMKVEIRQITSEIRNMSSEIRGIQTENKRILDHLFGTQPDQES